MVDRYDDDDILKILLISLLDGVSLRAAIKSVIGQEVTDEDVFEFIEVLEMLRCRLFPAS